MRRRPSSLADRRPHEEVVILLKQEGERTHLYKREGEKIVVFIES